MRKIQVIFIVGKSGSGKTSISKMLGEYFECDVLSFSKIGRKTGENISIKEINMIHNQIIKCICEKICTDQFIIVEGIASIDVLRSIKEKYDTVTFFINVPLTDRISRIAERECCTYSCAKEIEYAKERGKQKVGLDKVIEEADEVVNGRGDLKEILANMIYKMTEYMDVENGY